MKCNLASRTVWNLHVFGRSWDGSGVGPGPVTPARCCTKKLNVFRSAAVPGPDGVRLFAESRSTDFLSRAGSGWWRGG